MNILFVLYGDFGSNTANPLALYARELRSRGHHCAIAVPSNLDSIDQHDNPAFLPVLYADVLASPGSVFPNGRVADVIHACTPREIVRHFVTSYMAKQPTPLVIYLEDNESWISTRWMGLTEDTLTRLSEDAIADRLPDALSHPLRYGSFIGLADAAAVIQDKLKVEVPPWVHCETVMIGVDVELFSPRPPSPLLRKRYNLADHERVIVYHGGLDSFKTSAIEALCKAVGIVNRQGIACRLLRTGPQPLAFLKQFPEQSASAISDLGVLPKHELPDLLALAEVFVQPGFIDAFEDLRLPGKVPEFLAMGRPVIMPDANIATLFRDGVDAVLLRSGSPDEIAEKCIDLFSDPIRANAIGRAGRDLAEKYFDARIQAGCLEAVYTAVCSHFDPELASQVWRNTGQDPHVNMLLARKLRLISERKAEHSALDARQLLKTHVNFIESTWRRLHSLESVAYGRECQIAEQGNRIAELDHAVAVYRNSRSWRLTRPFRLMARTVRRALRLTP